MLTADILFKCSNFFLRNFKRNHPLCFPVHSFAILFRLALQYLLSDICISILLHSIQFAWILLNGNDCCFSEYNSSCRVQNEPGKQTKKMVLRKRHTRTSGFLFVIVIIQFGLGDSCFDNIFRKKFVQKFTFKWKI